MKRIASADYFLGIDAGGTRTIAMAMTPSGKLRRRAEFGPANLRLVSNAQLLDQLRQIAKQFPSPAAVGIGIAGARDEADRNRVRAELKKVWPDIPSHVGNDLAIVLAAASELADSKTAKVLVLSGTGSCCYGETEHGGGAKVGGWGHLLGDRASGYDLAVQALRNVVSDFDRRGQWGLLGKRLLRSLALNDPNELIGWMSNAPKNEVAALAPEVFYSAKQGDGIARGILRAAAESLASDAANCASRLARTGEPVIFVLAGSVLLKQPDFARNVSRGIRQQWKGAKIITAPAEGAVGAALLGQRAAQIAGAPSGKSAAILPEPGFYVPEFLPNTSPTEQRNPRTADLHKLSIPAAVERLLSEEAIVVPSLLWAKDKIAQAAGFCSDAVAKGGRILYVGAGTSGRLGVLDASECPPTFRSDPEMVQGIIAGSQKALWSAVEGAEDDASAGARAMTYRGVTAKDVVVGIAASGRTPFVWGAIAAAKKRKAQTVLLCFNPNLNIDPAHAPDLVIAPNLGPEALTGSTRLKCGTATKLILNAISTITMIRAGKVVSNLMVDLNPSNTKLRDRAIRIVQELTGADAELAQTALERSGWVVKDAWRTLEKPAKAG